MKTKKEQTPEQIAKKAAYYQKNKVRIAARGKIHRETRDPAQYEAYQQAYRLANGAEIAAQRKAHYETNIVEVKAQQKIYQQANAPKIAAQRKAKYDLDATCPLKLLKRRSRGLVKSAFRRMGFEKSSKTADLLGCTFPELYKQIESLFTEGMSWERMHLIDIDHIYPISLAKTEAEVIRLSHHSNLQPLWVGDNRAKGNKTPEEWAQFKRNRKTL